MGKDTFITLAIHTYDRALIVKDKLESYGINVKLQNVNLKSPTISSGVRVRIPEQDLPLALRIVEGDSELHLVKENATRNQILIPIDFSENSITAFTDSMDVSLSELRELVMDREAWRAVIHGVAKSRT